MTHSSAFETDDRRWEALLRRDKAANGIFLYGVRTTGIFCKPTCSSRLPNRINIEFFTNPEEALSAGYRACKRCKPTHTDNVDKTERKIIQACRILEQSETIPKLADLAKSVDLSPYYFHRLFKKHVGITPKQYGNAHRSRRLNELLRSNNSVTEAIYKAGYSSSSGAYCKKQNQRSMKPKEYKSGGKGLTITYGITTCFLGSILVGATEQGICTIQINDDARILLHQLHDTFPKAILVKAESEFDHILEEVVKFIESPQEIFNLPLDIQGTAFQQKVWNVLREVKPGTTLSYTELAEKIGNPKAARAVATACGANKLAVAIPCHRIISKHGGISGFRWGKDKKKMLLEHEQDQL